VLEEVLFDHRAGVAHGLVAIANANGLAAVSAQGRPRAEMVVVDGVPVGLASDLDLQGRRVAGLACEVTVVEPVLDSEDMDVELGRPAPDRRVGYAAMPSRQPHAVARGGNAAEKETLDEGEFAVDLE